MATVYSGYSDGWVPSGSSITKKYRAKLVYSTSSTDTTYTISASVAVNINSSVGASYSASLSLAGTSYSGSGKTVFGEDNTVTLISTKSKSISKTHSAQTVTVSGKVKSSNGSWDGNYVTASASISIPAKTHYTLTYNACAPEVGATVDMHGLNTTTKWYGEPLGLSMTQPTCDNYIFQGWATSEANARAGTVAYAAGGTYSANSGGTLYAVWSPVLYSLTFNYNNEDTDPAHPHSETESTTVEIGYHQPYGILPEPTWQYHVFDGWYTAKIDGDEVDADTVMEAVDTEIYAHWHKGNKTVVYNIDSSLTIDGNFDPQIAVFDTSIQLKGIIYEDPARYTYEFQGWATSADSQTVDFAPGENYTNFDSIVLYPVMKLVYAPPELTNIAALRVKKTPTDTYEEDETGQYGHIKFNYNMFTYTGNRYGLPKPSSNEALQSNQDYYTKGLEYNIFLKTSNSNTYYLISDISITDSVIVGTDTPLVTVYFPVSNDPDPTYILDETNAYDIKIVVRPKINWEKADGTSSIEYPWETEIYLTYIGKAMYILDIINENEGFGLAVGKVATEPNLFDVGWDANFDGVLTASYGYLTTAPTADNLDGGLRLVVLDAEPATKYEGWLYLIKE